MTEQESEIFSGTVELADGSMLHCGEALRVLPGKRYVCEAWRGGQRVVAKFYLDSRRGQIHLQRELAGLNAFSQAGIAAPTVLWHGLDRRGHPVLVANFVEQAQAVNRRWESVADAQREGLLTELSLLLARHHQAGLCQADVHLGNFLLSGETFYSIDGDAVVISRAPLARRLSLDNLALLYAQLKPEWDGRSATASITYASHRGWSPDPIASDMPAMIERARQRRWHKLRDKLYRDCTAVTYSRVGVHEQFVVRTEAAGLQVLLDDPDVSCPRETAQLLKNGNTATVWRAALDDSRVVVVKRYNVKGWLHGLARRVKESRASVSWRNAHMLKFYGIATPAPLACVLPREGPLRASAYFVAEAVDGVSLRDWVEGHVDSPEDLRPVAQQIASLFALLHRLRISHGDMKASNFILYEGRIFVIDLDVMCVHRWVLGFARAWRKDMARFAANWCGMPQVADVFDQELNAALSE